MVRQYRIERLQGAEVLVCEVYDRYLWTHEQYNAFEAWLEEHRKEYKHCPTYADFSTLLNEWCDIEHGEDETFYGLREPIPVLNPYPSVVLRGIVVDNRFVELHMSFLPSVTIGVMEDEFHRFSSFLQSPHWRNTVARQIQDYGSLFTSDNG